MILFSYGTRPEYIKIKPLLDAFAARGLRSKLLYTGQHCDIAAFKYDYSYSIPDGENRLNSIVDGAMSFSMTSVLRETPDLRYVLVQGDTTSAFAVALSAFHNGIGIIHLEAGLRTYDNDNPYPEEQNRRLISQIANIHLCPTETSLSNLLAERVGGSKYVVGNTAVDNLVRYKSQCKYGNTVLVTMHRRENHASMREWFVHINLLAERHPQYDFILPIHPNPNVRVHRNALTAVRVIEPVPHSELLDILCGARIVITDSGGLQEECSFLNKKCLVCRTVTERPEAVGYSSFMVRTPSELKDVFEEHAPTPEINFQCPYGNGDAAHKITQILIDK